MLYGALANKLGWINHIKIKDNDYKKNRR